MKNDLCANDGYIPVARYTDNFVEDKFLWYIECVQCGQRTKLYKSEKKATRKWNKQQRQTKPQEWAQVTRSEIIFLYRTIGRQVWLDCLEDKDIVEIRDNIIPVFQKHLQLRKLGEVEIEVLADNAQQLIELCKLRTENGQLHQRIIEYADSEYNLNNKRAALLEENQQLRKEKSQVVEQIMQAVELSEQVTTLLMQVVSEVGKAE